MTPAEISGPDVSHLITTSGTKIPVIAGQNMIFSPWKPTTEDIWAMQQGKPVWIIFRGYHVTEFTMLTGDKEVVVPHRVVTDALIPDKTKEQGQLVHAKLRQQARLHLFIGVLYYLIPALVTVGLAYLAWRSL